MVAGRRAAVEVGCEEVEEERARVGGDAVVLCLWLLKCRACPLKRCSKHALRGFCYGLSVVQWRRWSVGDDSLDSALRLAEGRAARVRERYCSRAGANCSPPVLLCFSKQKGGAARRLAIQIACCVQDQEGSGRSRYSRSVCLVACAQG